MKGFTFHLLFKKLYEIETQMSLAAKLKAFLRAASFLNLHCTVPDTGNLLPGLVILFKWRAFVEFCRVDCLKYWVGQEKSSLGFVITSYGKTRTNFWASPVTGTVWSQGRSNEQYTTADPDFVVEFMDVHRGAVRTCQGLPPLICLAPGLRVSCSGKQGLQNRKENTS